MQTKALFSNIPLFGGWILVSKQLHVFHPRRQFWNIWFKELNGCYPSIVWVLLRYMRLLSNSQSWRPQWKMLTAPKRLFESVKPAHSLCENRLQNDKLLNFFENFAGHCFTFSSKHFTKSMKGTLSSATNPHCFTEIARVYYVLKEKTMVYSKNIPYLTFVFVDSGSSLKISLYLLQVWQEWPMRKVRLSIALHFDLALAIWPCNSIILKLNYK